MNVIEALMITMGLDARNLERGLDNAQDRVQAFGREIVRSIAGPLGTAFAGFSISSVVNQFIQGAEAAGKLAVAVEGDTESIQAWQRAAERSGGSGEAFAGSLKSLHDKLQGLRIKMDGETVGALYRLGVSFDEMRQGGKNSLDVMLKLSESAEHMGKLRFQQWAGKLGIDKDTINMLLKGRQHVEELVKQQKELGGYTAEDAKVAREAKNALADLKQAFQGIATVIGRYVTPVVTFFANIFKQAVAEIRKHEPFILALLATIGVACTKLAIKSALAFAPFIALGAIIAGIALIIDDFVVYCQGGKTALGEFWAIFGTGEEITATLTKLWDGLKNAVKGVIGFIYDNRKALLQLAGGFAVIMSASTIFGKVQAAAIGFMGALKGVKTAVTLLWNVLKANPLGLAITLLVAIIYYWEDIVAWAQKAIDAVVKFGSEAWNSISQWIDETASAITTFFSDAFDTVVDGIKNSFTSAKDFILGIFDGVVNTIKGWIDAIVKPVKEIGKSMGFYKENQETDWEQEAQDNVLDLSSGDAAAQNATPASVNGAKTTANTTNNNNTSVNVGTVTVNTQATDAQGVASGFLGGLNTAVATSGVIG